MTLINVSALSMKGGETEALEDKFEDLQEGWGGASWQARDNQHRGPG